MTENLKQRQTIEYDEDKLKEQNDNINKKRKRTEEEYKRKKQQIEQNYEIMKTLDKKFMFKCNTIYLLSFISFNSLLYFGYIKSKGLSKRWMRVVAFSYICFEGNNQMSRFYRRYIINQYYEGNVKQEPEKYI